MSGVSCDKSAVLKFGQAGDSSVESGACKFFGSFCGPFSTGTFTKKEDGCEQKFVSKINVDRVKAEGENPAGWKTSAEWCMGSKCQTSAVTFGSCYKSKGKCWQTWADWGEALYPGLNFYSGANYSNSDDCNLLCKMGVIWGSEKFGFASELSRNFKTNTRDYAEKCWYEKGPLKVGLNFQVGLKPWAWKKYTGTLAYTPNDSLSVWLSHCNEDKKDLKLGALALGGRYKLNDGCNLYAGACKSSKGLKWAVGA